MAGTAVGLKYVVLPLDADGALVGDNRTGGASIIFA